jgi:hypothetical protein
LSRATTTSEELRRQRRGNKPFALERKASIEKLRALGITEEQIAQLAVDAHTGLTPKQLELNQILRGPQRHTLFYGGARSGKTVLYVRAIMARAIRAPGSRHGMFRFRANAARNSLWLDTVPRVHKYFFPHVPMRDHRQDGYISIGDGSEIWIGGLDEKERVEKILGMEFSTLYFNECSQIVYSSIILVLSRLAQVHPKLRQRAYYDLNPTGSKHYTAQLFIHGRDPLSGAPIADAAERRHAFINPKDNLANLSPEFLASLEAMPERQRRRFFEGIYQADIDGALWTFETIDHARCPPTEVPADLKRVVVAIDPSGTKGDEDSRSDNVGIIVAGKSVDNVGYVLADRTCNLPPEAWARVAVNAFHEFKADRIVAEQNFGGDMVRAVIHTVDRNVPVHMVSASRGKSVRAEPVSALYGFVRDGQWHKDQVRHAGDFRELEDEMLNFSTAGYLGDRSPDRADALVWAMSDLFVQEMKSEGHFEWSRQMAASLKPKPPPAPKPVYAPGSVEWQRQQDEQGR